MLDITDGHKEIRGVQIKFNKRIDQAPTKSGWNKYNNTVVASKRDLEFAKFNAIKAICVDYATFGIELLSIDNLERYRPVEESLVEQTRRELG